MSNNQNNKNSENVLMRTSKNNNHDPQKTHFTIQSANAKPFNISQMTGNQSGQSSKRQE